MGPCCGQTGLVRQAPAPWSWPAHSHVLAELTIISTHHCLSASHSLGWCVSHQPDNWLNLGLAPWEPVLQGTQWHGNSRTSQQVSSRVNISCHCSLWDPMLADWTAVTIWVVGTRRWAQEPPAHGPRDCSRGGSCFPSPEGHCTA